MVFIVIYFPVDIILTMVIKRHCNDQIYIYLLRRQIHHTIELEKEDPEAGKKEQEGMRLTF
jgi:hypothetical protein